MPAHLEHGLERNVEVAGPHDGRYVADDLHHLLVGPVVKHALHYTRVHTHQICTWVENQDKVINLEGHLLGFLSGKGVR